MKRPKLIAVLLATGILVLIAGGALAASLPSWPSHKATMAVKTPAGRSASSSPTPSSPTAQPPGRATSTTVPAPAPKAPPVKKPLAKPSITYTVKAGDTLSGIAHWFKLHGYGALYAANEAIIGSNPNLIFPGERITISNGVMKLSGTRS